MSVGIEQNLLNRINNSNELKQLSQKQLILLCEEIRQFLIQSVLMTGGHLSSNLGVVELVVALHYVFDLMDSDKLIFDVSHQSYVHKILTGRREYFDTLRQYQGLCGYTHPKESPADFFWFAHAGTSISTSLGISIGQQLQDKPGRVIAFIGDASVGCGVALEALNHTGHLNQNLIVILNDNCMSISESVGALSRYLTKLRMNSTYQKLRQKAEQNIQRIPWIGKHIVKLIDSIVQRIKPLIDHQGAFFQTLGFNYYGPIDGHDVSMLVRRLRGIAHRKGPVLIHVKTKKGKGYPQAISDPIKYHGVSANQHQKKEELPKTTLKFTNVFSQSLIKLATTDQSIVAITASMPLGTGLNAFQKQFPNRYFDVGICEQHAVAMSAGLAKTGLKPICCIYSTFLQRAYDQMFQEICLNCQHVVFALDRAGIVGPDGATHAGLFDIAYLRTFPNIILMAPSSAGELDKMLYFALYDCNQPVAIRYPRDDCPMDAFALDSIELGKFHVIKEGHDLMVVVYGALLQQALSAIQEIQSRDNLDIGLINARFAKPICDNSVKELYQKGCPIILIEDHAIYGGFGSAILEKATTLGFDTSKTYQMGLPDYFVDQGTRSEILSLYGLDSLGIQSFIRKKLYPTKEVDEGS